MRTPSCSSMAARTGGAGMATLLRVSRGVMRAAWPAGLRGARQVRRTTTMQRPAAAATCGALARCLELLQVPAGCVPPSNRSQATALALPSDSPNLPSQPPPPGASALQAWPRCFATTPSSRWCRPSGVPWPPSCPPAPTASTHTMRRRQAGRCPCTMGHVCCTPPHRRPAAGHVVLPALPALSCSPPRANPAGLLRRAVQRRELGAPAGHAAGAGRSARGGRARGRAGGAAVAAHGYRRGPTPWHGGNSSRRAAASESTQRPALARPHASRMPPAPCLPPRLRPRRRWGRVPSCRRS